MSNKVELNQDENPEEYVSVNNLTVEEAAQHVADKNYQTIADNILLYVPYEEVVDMKPEQLLGTQTEDEASGILDNNMFSVVGIGPDAKYCQVGDRVQIHPRYLVSSLMDVPLDGLKFALCTERIISVVDTSNREA